MDDNEKSYGRRRIKKVKPLNAVKKSEPVEPVEPAETVEKKEIKIPVSSIEDKKPGEKSLPIKRKPTTGDREEKRPRTGRQDKDRDKDRDRRRTTPKPRDDKRSIKERPKRGKVRVSIVVPAFNEADNVRPLLKQFDEVISNFNDWEVVYVDDGSSDDTVKLAKQAGSRYSWLKVISHNQNQGLTAALDTGFKSARGSIFVFYPADMQYHPEDIPRMIAKIDRGADIVTGWKQGKYNKRFVSSVYNKICRMLFDIKVHDLNSVKAFRKEVLDNITMRRDWHRYIVVLAAENDFRISETKVNLYPRKHGKSKFGSGRILGGVLDLFSVKFQISFMKRPLRFFGTWGFIAGFSGILVGLLATYLRFFTTHGSRTLLYLVILLVLSGLGLFALGFLAEVMVGLRDEISALKKKK